MNFIGAINPLYSISGFAVGALVGMTGVGGGSLMTPLLVLLFGFHPATAVGTASGVVPPRPPRCRGKTGIDRVGVLVSVSSIGAGAIGIHPAAI